MRDSLARENPRIVGITCLFSGDMEKILLMAPLIKQADRTIRIAIGGVHPTIFSREILDNAPAIDFVVKGEGEISVLQLAETVRAEGSDFSHIDGLAWRDAAGGIVEQKKASYVEDLDSLPPPAYDLFPIDDYCNPGSLPNAKQKPFRTNFPLLTSRSCGRVCNFCSLFNAMGRKARMHSAGRVLDEIEHLYQTYGMTYFDVEDDNFTLSKARTLEICSGIVQRGLDIQLRLRNGVHIPTIDDEVADALAAAGLTAIYLAIESGSEYIRNKVIGKNVPTEKIFAAAAALARHPQVTTGAFIIVGMPEETEETARDTEDLLGKLDVDSFFFMPATPYPGTRLFDQCLRDSLFTPEYGDFGDLWRRGFRIEQTLYDKNPLMIQPYAMTLNELRGYCRRLEALQVDLRYRSLVRKSGEAVARAMRCIRDKALSGSAQEAPPRLYIFGAGSLGRLIAGRFTSGVAVEGIIDNNQELWGREIAGLRVASPATIAGKDAANSIVLICVLNKNDAQTVRKQFAAMGVHNVVSMADELYAV